MSHNARLQRLFVDAALHEGARVAAGRAQAHYLLNVLRLGPGGAILLFNGRDGEWRARIAEAGRKACVLKVEARTRPQPPAPDLHLLFAPLKQARLDYLVEKAVEMGVGRLIPVVTRHGQVARVNESRLRAHAVEAAEQCGALAVPAIEPIRRLDTVLAGWPDSRRLVFCDEGAEATDPIAALAALPRGPLGVLIGPEGGFSETERGLLRARPYVTAIGLGPRVLRADTAAVAALALVQAVLGDWR